MTKEDLAEIMSIFQPLGQELAADIVKHRRAKKCELTPRGARALMREYEATGTPIAAAEEHLNRGWQGFKAEWMTKGRNFTDPNNPMPRTETREEYLKRAIEKNKEDWEGSADRRVASLIAAAARH